MSGIATTAPAPVKKPDYIDELLIDAAYEIIRREKIYMRLSNEAWDAAAVDLAAKMRPAIETYLAENCE